MTRIGSLSQKLVGFHWISGVVRGGEWGRWQPTANQQGRLWDPARQNTAGRPGQQQQDDTSDVDRCELVSEKVTRKLLSRNTDDCCVCAFKLFLSLKIIPYCVIPVGEPDARAWLEQHIVTPYWVTQAPRFPHSLHLHSNLLNVW